MSEDTAGTEVWWPVAEWPYQVSNHGRVRRADPANGTRPGRLKSQQVNWGGYHRVQFSDRGRQQRFLVHRLVYEAFFGPVPDGLDCHHVDGDKSNNRADNLRAVSRSENLRHAARTGLRVHDGRKGEDHPRATLTADEVREMRRRYEIEDVTQSDLADDYGTSQANVGRIVNREAWTHVE